MIMTEISRNGLIMRPDWMIDDNADKMLDDERQMYMTMSFEQKFKAAIAACDFSGMYELVFHFLNINALTADGKMYDANFKEITGCTTLNVFAGMINDENCAASKIVARINKTYYEVLQEYMDAAIKYMHGVKMEYFNAKNVHHSNSHVYVIAGDDMSNAYELYRITYSRDATLGNMITKIADMMLDEINIAEFKTIAAEINKKRNTPRISALNTIFVRHPHTLNRASVITLIKDIVLLNKIMRGKNQFMPEILRSVSAIIREKKTLPFKLIIN